MEGFNSRASCEARLQARVRHPVLCVSIHAPLARRDSRRGMGFRGDGFNSRASCEARLRRGWRFARDDIVSIHAPLARRDSGDMRTPEPAEFQFTRLLRGATAFARPVRLVEVFQFTRLLRGATTGCGGVQSQRTVSIHAPLARRDMAPALCEGVRGFNSRASCEARPAHRERQRVAVVSIHAPLARRDLRAGDAASLTALFQFTRLLRGATFADCLRALGAVSIHAPLARRDTGCGGVQSQRTVSIHAPLARRDAVPRRYFTPSMFQFTRLLRGATVPRGGSSALRSFNSRASCEARPARGRTAPPSTRFNSRASCEARPEG